MLESELLSRLERLESNLSDISKRLSRLEMTSSDIERYGKLHDFLATGQWREADLETTRVMLEIGGGSTDKTVETYDTLRPENFQDFPCKDLRLIDQLWTHYSNGRFGLSVQFRIYQELGGNINTLSGQDIELIRALRQKTGRSTNNLLSEWEQQDFSLSAPIGSFPSHYGIHPYGFKIGIFIGLRLLSCGICTFDS